MNWFWKKYAYHVSYRSWAKYQGDRESFGDGIFYLAKKLDDTNINDIRILIANNINESDVGKIQIISISRV